MRNQTGHMNPDMDMGNMGNVIQQGEVRAIMDGVKIRKRPLYITGSKRIKGKCVAPSKEHRKGRSAKASNPETETGVKMRTKRKVGEKRALLGRRVVTKRHLQAQTVWVQIGGPY